MAFDAYEHAVRSNPDRAGERRHRVERLEAIADDELPRMKRLGLLASLRPIEAGRGDEAGSDGALAAGATCPDGQGPSRAGQRLAIGSAGSAGGPHTRSPARRRDADPDAARLSLKAAIDAYTSGSAWASFDEQRKGTIAPGMLADLVVLSEDILTTPAKLPGAHVDVTIFDGKVVFRRSPRATN